jgi:hypothetical protein
MCASTSVHEKPPRHLHDPRDFRIFPELESCRTLESIQQLLNAVALELHQSTHSARAHVCAEVAEVAVLRLCTVRSHGEQPQEQLVEFLAEVVGELPVVVLLRNVYKCGIPEKIIAATRLRNQPVVLRETPKIECTDAACVAVEGR